jgi:hypothetical protein
MNVCKHYVSGRCTNLNCRFEHIDNVCRDFFFSECNKINCKYTHEYQFINKNKNKTYISRNNSSGNNLQAMALHSPNNNLNKSPNKSPKKIKNTESFKPSHNEPTIRVRFNEKIKFGNEISIINNMFYDKNLYSKLLSEISNDVYKPWHGDTHLIADDTYIENWKENSLTFKYIIKELCSYFCMTPSATRLNYYTDSKDWKPYHHDAAALKPDKAKTQNITVGVSFGETREISFESTHNNKQERLTLNFPLKDSIVYSFGNQVNVNFRHGIPQLKEESNKGRISIIIWGYSSLIE